MDLVQEPALKANCSVPPMVGWSSACTTAAHAICVACFQPPAGPWKSCQAPRKPSLTVYKPTLVAVMSCTIHLILGLCLR